MAAQQARPTGESPMTTYHDAQRAAAVADSILIDASFSAG